MNRALRPYLVSATVSIGVFSLALCLFALWANRDTSIYAPGYSESAFSRIREGMPFTEVQRLVGDPLSVHADAAPEIWFYGQGESAKTPKQLTTCVPSDLEGVVEFGSRATVVQFSGRCSEKLSPGLSKEAVSRLLGEPLWKKPARAKTLWYSALGNAGVSRVRIIVLDEADRVSTVIRYTTHD